MEVWFEEAQSAFRDPHSHLFHDPEHSEEEDRFILIGVSSTARPPISLLQGIRFSDSDHFRTESNQEGG
jgi:uncharacterized DUF497 family protein